MAIYRARGGPARGEETMVCHLRCLRICILLLLPTVRSYEYEIDEAGIPILWEPQKGLLFSPDGDKKTLGEMSDEFGKFFPQDNEAPGRRPAVIAFHGGHDASIAIGVGGRVQCVLELERWFEIRYFYLGGHTTSHMSEAEFGETWFVALKTVLEGCECEGNCPQQIHYAVLDNLEYREYEVLKDAVEPLLGQEVTWRFANHHRSHALLGFYASPFRSAIIMSYDAGGNDGVFNFYVGLGLEMKFVAKLPINLGMAVLLPEVTGAKGPKNPVVCSEREITPYTLQETAAEMHGLPNTVDATGKVIHSYAGKFMGYSALVSPDPEVQFWAKQYIRSYFLNETAMEEAFTWLRHFACTGTEAQRTLAASAQAEWTDYVEELFEKFFRSVTMLLPQPLEGIVLTGGCALNVLANQRIFDRFTDVDGVHPNLPRSLYVPPASNDGGIVVGALWSVMPPFFPQPLQYLGFPLFDLALLDEAASSRQAQRLTELGGVEYLADLLAGGEAWKSESPENLSVKPIIAVVLGRQEFGPRALGHRSLLAVPDSHDIKDRMNQLKARQSYRPVAPMIADEALEEVFGPSAPKSPYMTMAPQVKEEVRERFPALAHVDGTARHQSVGAKDEPWIHALLLAVGKRTGLAALINTSFNSKGKPIVNTVKECLKMLDDLPDLDYVLIEDWLFRKKMRWNTWHQDHEGYLGINQVFMTIMTHFHKRTMQGLLPDLPAHFAALLFVFEVF